MTLDSQFSKGKKESVQAELTNLPEVLYLEFRKEGVKKSTIQPS
jgi:hypothetical protein